MSLEFSSLVKEITKDHSYKDSVHEMITILHDWMKMT